MGQLTVEMPIVGGCSVTRCTYNVEQKCRAKAITVGDLHKPECDTSFSNGSHVRERNRVAGVGACKVMDCQYNNDFECNAKSIVVGMHQQNSDALCMTFSKKTP